MISNAAENNFISCIHREMKQCVVTLREGLKRSKHEIIIKAKSSKQN